MAITTAHNKSCIYEKESINARNPGNK